MEVVPIESLISSVEAFVYHIKIRHFVFSENKLSRAPDGCGLTALSFEGSYKRRNGKRRNEKRETEKWETSTHLDLDAGTGG